MVLLMSLFAGATALAEVHDPAAYYASLFFLGVVIALLIAVGSWAYSLGSPRKVEQTVLTGRKPLKHLREEEEEEDDE